MSTSRFRLNFSDVDLSDADPSESLLRWLKRARLTGTKEGCGDGDCGACTVALVERDATGRAHYRAVNSCLLPIGALAGREVVTVEALAEGDKLHPVQQAMVDSAGSQCGYCTPGFVMSLFVGYYEGEFGDHVIDGNLCRCTGYQPIRKAAAVLAAQPRPADRFTAALDGASLAPAGASVGPDLVRTLPLSVGEQEGRPDKVRTHQSVAFHNPATVAEALALKGAHPDAAWIAGATDLGVALSRGQHVAPVLIALDRIAQLQQLEIGDEYVRIGAGVPLSRLEQELAGIFPALDQMLPWFAARQVKNRATLGGNLGSASPIGDLLPWLLAHDAVIEVQGPAGARELPIAGYFLDYRKTTLAREELILALRVPRLSSIQAAYKVAKRQTDDISIVAAVYAITLDERRQVTKVRLAYGGVAA
ncbi:MAG TPA: FAD binding domain-containing protein, partial [Xanthomonadales bacterium]|nr:FAD binding domain-containing protein [Xanthomonadales bacterium]